MLTSRVPTLCPYITAENMTSCMLRSILSYTKCYISVATTTYSITAATTISTIATTTTTAAAAAAAATVAAIIAKK